MLPSTLERPGIDETSRGQWNGGVLFAAVEPIGHRCTCNIGKDHLDPGDLNSWHFGLEEFKEELKALRSNDLDPALSESEQRDALARLKKLIYKARDGQLVFSEVAPEAKVMTKARFVIELRPQPEAEYRFGQPHLPSRLVRLYCAEPKLLDQTIMGLHLGTKPNAEDVDDEQNDSIDCAAGRANSWELGELRKRLDGRANLEGGAS